MKDDLVSQSIRDILNDIEIQAYSSEIAENRAELTLPEQDQLFGLFLGGYTCDEIQKLNSQYTLGAIVRARMNGEWDKKRDEYRQKLFLMTKDRVAQTVIESANFMAMLLSVTSKKYADRLVQFMQTGDDALLEGFSVKGVDKYAQLLEMLMKITGADQKKQVITGEITHKHENVGSSGGLKADQVSKILEILENSEDKDDE